MEILYVANFTSERTYWKTINESSSKPAGSASQTFERLMLEGLLKQDSANITVCSFRDISSYPGNKKIFWPGYTEMIYGNIACTYLPFINITGLKQICFSIALIPQIIKWIKRKRNTHRCILFTCINIPMIFSAFFLRFIFSVPVFTVVPDLPSMALDYTKLAGIKKILKKPFELFAKISEHNFDGYIFLTEFMNSEINRKKRPYIVIEGIADDSDKTNQQIESNMGNIKNAIMYAGALYEKFGIGMLISSFMRIHRADIELWLFGSGDMEKDIAEYCKSDPRIKYFGMMPREEVVKFEKEAKLLVNPRPTSNEFTKYSFPSKTIEYMASGTPLLTTRLQGIPSEYFDHVFVIDDETVEGMTASLERIMNIPQADLNNMGEAAKRFVIENKNGIIQTKKIFDFINANV